MIDLGPGRPLPGFWRSTRDPARPHPAGVASGSDAVPDALGAFRKALADAVSGLPGGSALTEPQTERRLARELGDALLPADLVDRLVSARDRGETPILRIHAARRLADIPWEVLAVDGQDTRLVEVAQVRMIPPPTGVQPSQELVTDEKILDRRRSQTGQGRRRARRCRGPRRRSGARDDNARPTPRRPGQHRLWPRPVDRAGTPAQGVYQTAGTTGLLRARHRRRER